MKKEKVSKFVELFRGLPDQRQPWKIKHKLEDILFISIVATIANCDDWEEIEWFANEKESWFRKYLELPNGIPSHDTIERVFSWLDPQCFRDKFLEWLKFAMGETPSGVVAIDGKTMCGSKDVMRKGVHVVNAWFSENGMILGQEFVQDKSNELKAIPPLIDILDITGHIVTVDAGGTYKEIAEKITDAEGDYVLALKGNQPNMLDEVSFFFEKEVLDKKSSEFSIHSVCKWEKGHGRIEKRIYYITDEIDWLNKKDDWKNLESIGMVVSEIEIVSTGKKTTEIRYFISSLNGGVDRFAYAVRKHWGVESMHWSLDTTFNEDGRRSRKNNSAKNLAQLIRLTYDIIKANGVPKRTPIKRLRKKALLDDIYLEKLISSAFK